MGEYVCKSISLEESESIQRLCAASSPCGFRAVVAAYPAVQQARRSYAAGGRREAHASDLRVVLVRGPNRVHLIRRILASPRCRRLARRRLLHLAVAAPSPALRLDPVSLLPYWHSKPEDAPNAAAEGTQPAPPEGSADTAPPASGTKAAEALLPSLTIWPPSQRTRDAVVRRLVQTLAAPSVLSQRYGAVPEPEAERAAAAVEAEAFAAASESAAGASPASVKEGIEVLQA